MMLGYPGAGKTTTAKAIAEITGAEHYSSDLIRTELFPHPTFSQEEHDKLYAELDRRIEAALAAGKDVIYDANLNRLVHRQEKYDICKRTHAQSVLLWVKTPRELAKTRAVHDSRQHLWPKDEAPNDMFERIAKVIEEPDQNEPFIEVDGTKVSPSYITELFEQHGIHVRT